MKFPLPIGLGYEIVLGRDTVNSTITGTLRSGSPMGRCRAALVSRGQDVFSTKSLFALGFPPSLILRVPYPASWIVFG